MKHIFVYNPAAGRNSKAMIQALKEKLKEYDGKIEYEFYFTKAQRDATAYIKERCAAEPDEQLRFYACGGDGTANEVLHGIVGAPNASMTVYPCGSGNDFVKYYGGSEPFLDVDALIAAINVEDKATIEAARTAYEALTAEQKLLVTKLAELEAAELEWKTVNTEVSLVLTGPEAIKAYDEAVTYTLSGKDMVNLGTFILTVDVPEELLAQPVVESADPNWYVIYQGVENGVLTISAGNNAGAFGDGEILTVTFVPTGKTGDAVVSVIKAELSAFIGVEDETFVPVNLSAAAVTTKVEHNIFDVNRDNVVNILDLTRAQRFYDTDNAVADVNGSGKVDIEDLILILNHYTDLFK